MDIHPGFPTKDVYTFNPRPCPDQNYQGANTQQKQDCGKDQLEKTSFPIAHIEIVKAKVAKKQRQQAGNHPMAGLFMIQTEHYATAVFARFLLIGNPSAAMGTEASTVAFGKAAMVTGKSLFPQLLTAMLTIHEYSSYGMLIQ